MTDLMLQMDFDWKKSFFINMKFRHYLSYFYQGTLQKSPEKCFIVTVS